MHGASATSRWSGRRRPGGTSPARGLGGRADARHRARRERVDAILEALAPTAPAGTRRAARRRVCLDARPRRAELLEFLARRCRRAGPRAVRDLVGQDRVVPYFFPTAGDARRHAARARGRRARPGRPVLLRHDDAGRSGHLGGGPRGRRRAPLTAVDLVAAGRAAAYALCRPPGHHATPAGYGGSCYLNNAAVAAEALRAAGHERVGGRRHRRPPRQRHRRRSSGSAPTCSTGRCTSTRLPAGSRTSSGTPTRPAPARARVRPATCRCPRAPATRPGGRGRRARRVGRGRRLRPLVVSLGVDAAGDDPESPLQVTADGLPRGRPAARRTGLPAVVVQEGGYHLPPWAGWSRRTSRATPP